jgi:hypothetical protein
MGTALITYLTTDQQVLGILAWVSTAITVLGFAVAIWQIAKVRRAADAARIAALDMARRVRSRELLAKLGDAHTYLSAAQNHVARGEREIAILCLELSNGFAIEAQEMWRGLARRSGSDFRFLIVLLSQLSQQLITMPDPIADQPNFMQVRLQIREAMDLLRQYTAQSRYTYDSSEA